MSYQIILLNSARKDLDNLDKQKQQRVIDRLTKLETDPLDASVSKPLVNAQARTSRVGDWRIIYEVSLEDRTVSVRYVRHRREVYRLL